MSKAATACQRCPPCCIVRDWIKRIKGSKLPVAEWRHIGNHRLHNLKMDNLPQRSKEDNDEVDHLEREGDDSVKNGQSVVIFETAVLVLLS